MNKTKAQITILVIIILVILGIGLLTKGTPYQKHDYGSNTQSAQPAIGGATNIPTETITDNSSPYLNISAQYPTSGIGSDVVTSRVKSVIAKFKSENNFSKTSTKELAFLHLSEDNKYTLDIQYSSTYGRKFLSHRLDIYSNTGGAHGNNIVETYTFDLQRKLVTFNNLFIDPNNALPIISTMVRNLLLADTLHNGDYLADQFEKGTAPVASNFSAFQILGDKLVIIFQEYQIAPYVEGNIVEAIPLSSIKDLLKVQYQ